MSTYTVTLPSGEIWTPNCIAGIDRDKCIGCARCIRVCARDVLALVGVNEDGDLIAIDPDDDEDEEYEKKVMTAAHPENCVGCEACSRVCPKKCYSHAPAEL